MNLQASTLEQALVVGAGLLLLGVVASKLSTKLSIPALTLFLGVGMLAGSEGLGGIHFDDFNVARSVGTVALAFILFAGGLDTSWSRIRLVAWRGVSLATIGVLVTAAIVGVIARVLLETSWIESLLLGAIVASTDAAAVFAVLRARGLRLKRSLTPTLEVESGSNDPTAFFLTVALTSIALNPAAGWTQFAVSFVVQMVLGAVMGIVLGLVWARLINRFRLEYDGLYPVLTLALVLVAYGLTTVVGGNGFLAVYAAGAALGSRNFVHRLALIQFHDGVAWLMQIAVFLVLGLLVFPSQLLPITWIGLALAFALVFVARPVAVFIALLGARMPVRDKLFISWVGLRGAVPIIFATIPITAGVPNGYLFFNIVFFVVVVSVMVQGTTISRVARALRVDARHDDEDMDEIRVPQSTIDLMLRKDSPAVGKMVVDLNLPQSALLILLRREGESYIPRGSTVLEVGDGLLIATRKGDAEDLRHILEG